MKLSGRELMLAWMTGVIVLFSLSFWIGKQHFDAWKNRNDDVRMLDRRIARDLDDIQSREQSEQRLLELQSNIRALPPGRSPANFLKQTVGALAKQHKVEWRDLREDDESENTGIYMMNVDCTWSSNTEGLVRLLYALQTHDVMFEVQYLQIKSSGKDDLSGKLTVHCVYTKLESEAPSGPARRASDS